MLDRESASSQRVYLSMAVRQYRYPEETGSGPKCLKPTGVSVDGGEAVPVSRRNG